jgi:hypothetical protein
MFDQPFSFRIFQLLIFFSSCRIRELFQQTQFSPLLVSQEVIDAKSASVHAIMEYMKLYISADPMPLSITDFFRYGTFTNKLQHRIKQLRLQSREIVEELLGLQEQGFGDVVDAALFQKFIIEQFTFLKRYVLRQKFDELFEGINQPQVDFWTWFFAWVATILW